MVQDTKNQSQTHKLPVNQISTVADTIVEQLAAYGVQRIYGVLGDTFLDLIDAIDRSQQIEFIAVKHESTAAFMASAEAKLTRRLGVCLAQSGPGIANLLNGLGDAYMDKAPVLAITGQVPTNKIGTDSKQYIDQQVLIQPLAAYSAQLSSPLATVDLFAKAIQTALQWSKVTHISVPKDLFAMQQTKPVRTSPQLIAGEMQVDPTEIGQAVAILKQAQRLVVVAGVGSKPAAAHLTALCDALGAGLILSMGARGTVDESYQYLLGGLGKAGSPQASQVLKQADVVLLAGDMWWPEGYVPENTRIVQIDVQGANIGSAFQVELGVIGSTEKVLPALVQNLQGHKPDPQWLQEIRQARQQWNATVEREASTEGSPVHPARLVRGLQRAAAQDAVICVDTGDHTVWFNRIFQAQPEQEVLFSGQWRSMGFALPAAMAAQLAQPERQVVALIGDGCLGMSLADLSTAARYDLPVKLVIVNNGQLQMETDRQIVGRHSRIGSDLTNPDFVKIAEACGLAGFKVTDSSELDQILSQAFSLPGPVLVDVSTDAVVFPVTEPKEA